VLFRSGYVDYLTEICSPGSSGVADLVAHFFNRAYLVLRANDGQFALGTMNLIATKSIRQGLSRESSLAKIRSKSGVIYHANRRLIWPGKAAVVISTVAISKGNPGVQLQIDGKRTSRINSFLLDADNDETPRKLQSNHGKSFVGMYLLGPGFMFDDSDPDVTSTEVMREILARNPEVSAYIKPYIGGEQVSTQVVYKPVRYTIDFDNMSLDEASRIRPLFSIVEEKVKPYRSTCNREKRRKFWWQYAENSPGLRASIRNSQRVLVANSAAAKYLNFDFVPNGAIYSMSLHVFSESSYSHFGVLQSRVHEIWVRLFASSLEDRIRYTASTCYENFPFPSASGVVESSAHRFHEARAEAKIRLSVGLTELSNKLNDSQEADPIVLELRALHVELDAAVLSAYGWTDIVPSYEFSGDYSNEDGSLGAVRYNFTEETRDEIIRRLLALHAERIAAEKNAAHVAVATLEKGEKKKKPKDSSGPDLFNL